MLRLAADENFNANIVRGLRLRFPSIDLVPVQDAGLSGADDPTVLNWAARERRILLTHDVTTLVPRRSRVSMPVIRCRACLRCRRERRLAL